MGLCFVTSLTNILIEGKILSGWGKMVLGRKKCLLKIPLFPDYFLIQFKRPQVSIKVCF